MWEGDAPTLTEEDHWIRFLLSADLWERNGIHAFYSKHVAKVLLAS
jgi:hypothetical protein